MRPKAAESSSLELRQGGASPPALKEARRKENPLLMLGRPWCRTCLGIRGERLPSTRPAACHSTEPGQAWHLLPQCPCLLHVL